MFKDNVVITGECFNLFRKVLKMYEYFLNIHFTELGEYNATITSANDGLHSENSLHYKNKAIDIRIKDVNIDSEYDEKYMEGVVLSLGANCSKFVFILHLYDGKNHLHIQHGRDNIISFDSAVGENNNVFIK
jgi:hypothetical protein